MSKTVLFGLPKRCLHGGWQMAMELLRLLYAPGSHIFSDHATSTRT